MTIIGRLRSRPVVARADAARDRQNWNSAADLYREALKMAPARAGVWVQLGHVLKERGAHEEAAEAYRRAMALRPRSADIHLQMGHLQKLRGDLGAAAASYARAVALAGRGAEDAANELQRLGYSMDTDGGVGRAHRGAAFAGAGSDIETRLDALSGQISTFLEHVSTTRALAFEVARCKSALEQLKASAGGSELNPPTIDPTIAVLNAQVRSLVERVSELEASVAKSPRGHAAALSLDTTPRTAGSQA